MASRVQRIDIVRYGVAILLLGAVLVGLQGCAVLALPAIGTAAIGSGAGEAVKAGTEYQKNGSVIRTFTLPLAEVRDAAVSTLNRMELGVCQDRTTPEGADLVARAAKRVVEITLEPITPVVTRMHLVVKGRFFSRDRATASEIVAQTEQTITRQFPSALPK